MQEVEVIIYRGLVECSELPSGIKLIIKEYGDEFDEFEELEEDEKGKYRKTVLEG